MRKELSIAVVLFTYNRPEHTKKVLDGLRHNELLPEKIIIFQDGKKESTNIAKWNAVHRMITDISWCNTETRVSLENKGLAKSIIQGVTGVLKEYEAVIVLEDDCVPHPKFMGYMVNALNKYAGRRQVYHINGYAWDTELELNGCDAYFGGRAGSWGWATWRDRWERYEEDYKIFSRIKKDEVARKQFAIWGKDLESYLLGNVNGTCDSWAVFWAMTVIEQHGFCVTPYRSLVDNIGFDGTGVHCGSDMTIKTRMYGSDRRGDLRLPEKIEFPLGYEKAIPKIFKRISPEEKLNSYYHLLLLWLQLKISSGSISTFFCSKGIKNIAIWGTGKICDLLLEELNNKVEVSCLIESNPIVKFYKNIPVKKIEKLDENVEFVLIIPVYDKVEIGDKIKKIDRKFAMAGVDEVINIVLGNTIKS